jgi:pantoate--beta-alanine ligase
MGNLHQGHINLLEASIQENDITVISIFVNPTQFSKEEDLSTYPRTFEEDFQKIDELQSKYNKEVIIFHPNEASEVYPDKYDLLKVSRFEKELEGIVRPTHFRGVITVVKFLFDIVKPTKAYFGKKDYQQLVVVQDLVKNYELNVQIVPIDICREKSGLAMSSRNNYLSKQDKVTALNLRLSLLEVSEILQSKNLYDANIVVNKFIETDQKFNYLEIREKNTFRPAKTNDSQFVVLGNYQVGSTRLLDNIEVN